MKVLNIHSRKIDQSKNVLVELFKSLATNEDQVWPLNNWPKMKFKDGLKVESSGGHGPIGYKVLESNDDLMVFQFEKPKGINGIHKFEITKLTKESTELRHTIDIETNGLTSLLWIIGIRPLHDALIEDAFDKVENRYLKQQKKTKWSLWVKLIRAVL